MKNKATPEIMTREKAFKYMYEKGHGNLTELKESIGEEFIEKFELVGYIRKGINNKREDTWNVTNSFKEIYRNIYKGPSLIESLLGLFCHYILRY